MLYSVIVAVAVNIWISTVLVWHRIHLFSKETFPSQIVDFFRDQDQVAPAIDKNLQ